MNKNIKIHESWLKYIEAEFDKEYMRNVKNIILNSSLAERFSVKDIR